MIKIFLAIFRFFERRRWLLITVFVSIIGLFALVTSRIKLEENIMQVLPGDKNTRQLTSFLENSKFSDRILFVISDKDTLSNPDPEKLIAAGDTFADALLQSAGLYIANLNYKASDSVFLPVLDVVSEYLPVFLDETDYESIDSLITLPGIKDKIEYNYLTLISPAGLGLKQFIASDPLGLNFIALKKFEKFKGDEQVTMVDQHFLSADNHHLLMFLNPRYGSAKTKENSEFINKLDVVAGGFAVNNPGHEIHYFGAPVVSAGNSKQIRSDTYITVTITIVILVLAFLLFFRNPVAPILVMVPVIFGGLFAVTAIYFIKGSVSVIALGAGSLVLGIAVNYSLHFLTHHRYHPDIYATIRELAFPMTAGSLTTIGGFLCLQFVDAPVLRDLGLYAALSLTGAAIGTLVFLPHFIRKKTTASRQGSGHGNSLMDRATAWLTGNKKLATLFIIITPFFLYFAGDVEFETDMYKINYMSPELKASEKFINRFSSYYQKSIFLIANGDNANEALKENEKSLPIIKKLQRKGEIISYMNVSTIFPSREEQERRIKLWNHYWNKNRVDSTYDSMRLIGAALKFRESAFDPFLETVTKHYSPLTDESSATLKTAFLNNFIEESNGQTSVIGLIRTTPEHAAAVYDEIHHGEHTLLFDRKFITDKLVNIVSSDFNFITLWTSLLVFFVLLIIYGRIELALISFIPMVLSWIWILGIMSLLGIKFNIINIVLSTLIFALGDDFCIFTTDGLVQEYSRNVKTLKSTAVSIGLSAFTTITGMGVLVLAGHPALNSIALVSIVGIFSVWIMSQVLQPVLFHFFITRPAKRNHEPFAFFDLLKSIFAFTYFVTGSLLISGIGIVLFRLIPIKSARKKYLYHVILSNFCKSMIYIMGNVKKTVINDVNEDFSKPAVIIANHSSFLDILLMVMLHPKLILLTNKWVWNSPVFGVAVRMAEYYPVAEGTDQIIDQLSAKVADGYSIVVFPEGTRSVDGKIARFHKGAFYLAEHLKLDVLPILIHGANYTMTKGFFFLKNGHLTLKILPRIAYDDATFGTEIRDRAKLIGRYFREQHKLLREELETPSYFKKQLFSNFTFKGPVLEWYMRIKVRLEKNYTLFNQLVPRKGKIVDIGCGYGFLSYMLSFTSSERNITGIDYDEEKIEVAQNGYSKGENLHFEYADALHYPLPASDVFILNDVLHYLMPEAQKSLLSKCIENLNPGGSVILRDGVRELEARHRGTKITELFSTRLLKFNKTSSNGLSFISASMVRDMAVAHGLNIREIDNTKYTSNVIFVLKKEN